MARGTTDKRRLIKFSNYSMCVTLPKWVIDQLEWKKGDQLTLVTDVKHGKITLYRDEEAAKAETVSTASSNQEAAADELTELQPIKEINDEPPPKLEW